MSERIIPISLIRQLFLLILIVVLGGLIFFELLPYFSGILGAVTIYILTQGIMSRMLDRGIKGWLAATLILIASVFVIILPSWLLVRLLGNKVQKLSKNSEQILAILKGKVDELEQFTGMELGSSLNVREINTWISEQFQTLLGSTFNMIIALSVMYFILYYLLINTKRLKSIFLDYMPLSEQNVSLISHEITEIVSSNAIGIPVVALLQGIVALIGFYIFGVPDPIFWFVITVVGSMIPFVGTALGIVPVTILLFANGQNMQAIGILIYGVAVVGVTDNVFRVIIQNKLAKIHPLITLIGVIIGVPLFGFIGLIFGPLLISLFMLVVKIYSKEYGESKEA
ncbi:AI-2E family transporter [Robertkochia sediminum]|uniref:AI-2E family transporter n=1 Tax=Robertkochia sediminum TaxID=2785326 RepID=UPI001933B36B|nr:AI-2E family transporter [Robertkochia sediminum]MBL7472763.1 AI-2E family transporter [Robertkochia sediminum]